MDFWVTVFIITASLQLIASAPKALQPFEQTMLEKLHKPWFTPDKYDQEYPRKGEGKCKREPCKVKEQSCEDCQYAVPIFDEDFLEKIKGKNTNKMNITGNSLGKRQKKLNDNVNEAATNNVDFDEVKAQDEADDLDKLFKIDLASKYKNVDYIIEVLKCGDSLYVTRALKCTWLYTEEYINFINPDYLHQNLIPFMSEKMKKKMLTSISMHVRDESRAASFYTYCKVTLKLPHFAEKFLMFTSESFKLNLINNDVPSLNIIRNSEDSLRNFLGNSFELVDAYLCKVEEARHDCLYALRHLYLISEVKYLELLEKYYVKDETKCKFTKRFGLRTSKDIIKKHKDRFNNHILLYAKILNISKIVKYTTTDEAKEYAARLLPNKCSTFWDINFCETYDFIINIVPVEDRYKFLKTIFKENYFDDEFEMDIKFYNLKYYKLLNVDEREAWALRHVREKKELFGIGEDFNWYKFVNFNKAFAEIKKYITAVPDSHNDVSKFFIVLVESTRNQQDIEKLLNYFYKNYANKNVHCTRKFLNNVTETTDVYDFDSKCWDIFEKLIFTLSDVYNLDIHDINEDEELRYIGLFYHMLHKKKLPDALRNFMHTEACFWGIKRSESFGKLNEERQHKIYEYVLQFNVDELNEYENQTYDDGVRESVWPHIYFVTELLKLYGKNEERDCPEIVKKYMKLGHDFYNQKSPMFTHNDLLRYLKEDTDIIVSKFHLMEHNTIERSVRRFKLNKFLSKLKIYFSNDFAQEILEFFINLFSHSRYVFRPKRLTSAVVFAIFHLADEDYKREFMAEYIPSNGIVDEYPYTICYRREAIRRFACYSRPPIPLSDLKPFILEKQLKFNLPMLNYYMSNLPLPSLMEFVETLLSFPVPIQTHGIRLAFKLFDSEKLKQHIVEAWGKSKDESMRKVIYTYLHKHLADNDDKSQNDLFEVLKTFTLDLSEKEHKDVISLMLDGDRTRANLRGKYLEVVWESLAKFEDNAENIVRMVTTVNNLNRNYHLIYKGFLKTFITENVYTILSETFVFTTSNHYYHSVLCHLHKAKWDLAATNFVKLNDDEETMQWILESLKCILKQFREMWSYVDDTRNVPATCFGFIQTLTVKHFECEREKCVKNIPIFETVLKELQDSYPSRDIYMLEWSLRLTNIANKALKEDNLQDIASIFGKELGNLVKESVDSKTFYSKIITAIGSGLSNLTGGNCGSENDQKEKDSTTLYTSFYSRIINVIHNRLSYIAAVIGSNLETLYDLHALVGIELLEFGILETDLLATEMLSFNSCSSSDYHTYLLAKLKQLESNEVKCLVQQKCLDGGSKFSLPVKKEDSTLVYNKGMDSTLVFVLD